MRIVHLPAELDTALAAPRRSGASVALVPTMGNLHAGHLELVAQARRRADFVVVSIFVNPLQFGPGKDYARYPRTLEADAQALRQAGVDLLFAPAVEQLYPDGAPATTVQPAPLLDGQLEGARRLGHFAGVATVVNLLFNRVRPQLALFGEKDWQQLCVIRRMVRDFGMPIEILGVPTVREADGLALSSRNQYLSAAQRADAAALHRSLQTAAQDWRSGQAPACIEAAAMERLRAAGFDPDYVAVRTPALEAPPAAGGTVRILAAARLGSTRLIDNVEAHA